MIVFNLLLNTFCYINGFLYKLSYLFRIYFNSGKAFKSFGTYGNKLFPNMDKCLFNNLIDSRFLLFT